MQQELSRRSCMVAVAVLLALVSVSCRDSGSESVTVTVQGLFQAEVPSGWQISIPQDFETDGPPPVLAAGPKGGDSGLAVFAPSASDAGGAFAEWSPRLEAELGEPASEHSNGQQRAIATGTLVDRKGKTFDVVVAGIQPDGASKPVVVFCQLSDLTRSDCDGFIDSLRAP